VCLLVAGLGLGLWYWPGLGFAGLLAVWCAAWLGCATCGLGGFLYEAALRVRLLLDKFLYDCTVYMHAVLR
jgi:hypothetical protein